MSVLLYVIIHGCRSLVVFCSQWLLGEITLHFQHRICGSLWIHLPLKMRLKLGQVIDFIHCHEVLIKWEHMES